MHEGTRCRVCDSTGWILGGAARMARAVGPGRQTPCAGRRMQRPGPAVYRPSLITLRGRPSGVEPWFPQALRPSAPAFPPGTANGRGTCDEPGSPGGCCERKGRSAEGKWAQARKKPGRCYGEDLTLMRLLCSGLGRLLPGRELRPAAMACASSARLCSSCDAQADRRRTGQQRCFSRLDGGRRAAARTRRAQKGCVRLPP